VELGVLAGLPELADGVEPLGDFGLSGAFAVPGEVELFDEAALFAEWEPAGEDPAGELANCQPEPASGDPPPDAPVTDDEASVPVLAVCVAPGSTMATAPAASTLAKPAVAVAAVSLRLPRSRSATARLTWRAGARARAGALRSSQLSMLAVCHTGMCGCVGFLLTRL
jgi:hypothetical protein